MGAAKEGAWRGLRAGCGADRVAKTGRANKHPAQRDRSQFWSQLCTLAGIR
jgi:hypothetical protein